MVFVEDGPAIFPLDIDQFNISDEDNSFILRATFKIENSNSNVRDELGVAGTSNERFRVMSNDNTTLVIEAVGSRRLITTHREMEDFLKTVFFSTDDQAPDIVRNLSVVVEEFPIGDAPLSPAYIPIYVRPVNDQPVLNSSRITEAPLTDYLPQESGNSGFNASFLLSLDDVQDIDRLSQESLDFVGVAIIAQEVPQGLGVWQYRTSDDGDWVDLPANLSLCNPFRANPSTRVRFSPSPSTEKQDGVTTIMFQAWDGSSEEDSLCNTTSDGG